MCKKILLLSLLLFQVGSVETMQSLPIMPTKIMQSIFRYAMWVEVKNPEEYKFGQPLPERSNNAWHTIKRNHTLQLVSKDFRCIFWDCFTQSEKNDVLRDLLFIKKKGSNCCLGIAMSMRASLYPILRHAIYEEHNPECVRTICDIGDTVVINKVAGFRGCWPTTPLHLAVIRDNVDSVQLLLNCPVTDVNATLPLFTAVNKESVEIVKLLLAHPKIQVNAVNEDGETALFAAATNAFDPRLQRDDSGFCKERATWNDFSLSAQRFPKNRLSCVVALLIKAGIDSIIKNKNGETAFDRARCCWDGEVFEMLEKAFTEKK